MKKQLRKLLALTLALVLSLGTVPTAGAYATPDFTDVPQSSWAYTDIMEMADLGVIKGTGGGKFSPAASLSVGEFLTLIGRAMYPTTETATFWESHYMAALEHGIITATEFAADAATMNRAITRYEMARIMVRVDEKVNGNAAVTAVTSNIPDFATVPVDFAIFVAQAYTKGLLKGTTGGKFDGGATLLREQAAAVVKRLLDAKAAAPAGSDNKAKPLELSATLIELSVKRNANTVQIMNAADGPVNCVSSEEDVVEAEYREVESSGARCVDVRAISTGTSVVTITDSEGKTGYVTVNCDMKKPLEPFTIERTSVELDYDNPGTWLGTKGAAGDGSVEWISSNPEVVQVSTLGRAVGEVTVVALKAGTAIITGTDTLERTVTCTVTSTYKVPDTPRMWGEMITVTFGGHVKCYDYNGEHHDPTYPAGVKMVWKSKDGRVLGETTTFEPSIEWEEWGGRLQQHISGYSYIMTATIDKADLIVAYGMNDDYKAYQMECYYVDENGVSYSNVGATLRRGQTFYIESFLRSNPAGRVEGYDFTINGGDISFSVDNYESRYLTFDW